MKVIKILPIIMLVVACNFNVFSNDTIRLTWTESDCEYATRNTFKINATLDEPFRIDWGDGSILDTAGIGEIQTFRHNYEIPDTYSVIISGSSNTCIFTYFDCHSVGVGYLDVSKSPGLLTLHCMNNQIRSLDVSKNTALRELDCPSNKLSSLDISTNIHLINLYCYDNQINSLDVSANTKLIKIDCAENPIGSLNVSNNTDLEFLYCENNGLSSLDVSNNTALYYLNAENNQISNIDLSANSRIEGLELSNNLLESIDVSMISDLYNLYCSNNKLNNLTLNTNIEVSQIFCYDNRLSLSDLYNVSQRVSEVNRKKIGKQIIDTSQVMVGEEIDFSSQSKLGDNNTVFVVEKDNTLAVKNVDYTIDNGIIIFKNAGNYTVTMTNAAITSHADYPAEVKAGFIVEDLPLSIQVQTSTVDFYPNPTTGVVNTDTESKIKVYNIQGIFLQETFGKEVNLSTYPQGIYFFEVDGMWSRIVKN